MITISGLRGDRRGANLRLGQEFFVPQCGRISNTMAQNAIQFDNVISISTVESASQP
jgi:hypothetical protein